MQTEQTAPDTETTPDAAALAAVEQPAATGDAVETPDPAAGDAEAPADFSATDVPEFGNVGDFEGSMPGEAAPDTSGTPQAPGALDAFLAGVDMTDPTADFKAGKPVPFDGIITSLEPWPDPNTPGRLVIKLGITPVSPPLAKNLGAQTVWCDIANPSDVSAATKGKSTLRSFAASAGRPMSADGKKLADGKSLATLIGAAVKGKLNKGKTGSKIFVNP